VKDTGGHGSKFGRKKEAAIAALLAEPTIESAAKAAGVSGATLWRWMQEPGFDAEYRRARRASLGQAISQLQAASSAAVKALRAVAEDGAAPPAARVSAARAVLEIGIRAIEVEDLEARISQLEKAAKHGHE
jgi:DNA-binding MurR/RpiR family transcriptional regulator